MFWNIVIGLLSFALQMVLAPKPQNAKPASLDDFEAPTAEEGREIPVLFGTKDIKGPNVVWYGNLKTQAIKGARRYGLFGPKQTIGYKYYLGMHMVLCHGVADALFRIRVGEKDAWTGFERGSRINISKKSLFGGDKREGGISGALDLEMGAPDQGRNDYLQARLGSDCSAHRGVVGVVLRRMYLGTTPYIKPWEFRLQRIYKRSDGTAQWYETKAGIGLVDHAAIYFALDVSGSMIDLTGNGQTRLANMKTAVTGILADMQVRGLPDIDIRMVAWENVVTSAIERREIVSSQYDDLISWVNGLTASGGTDFNVAVSEAAAFFAGSGTKRRIVIFVTDGEPNSPSSASAAAAALSAISNVDTFAFNIDLSSTTYTALLDNTPADGVPVISGGDPQALKDALLFALSPLDMNPAHIIRECLTDKTWGMGYNDADIDDTSFTATADALYAEGFGLTLLWQREEEIEEFVTTVISHIDAHLYTSRQTGKFHLKLIRADYDLESLPVIDEDDIVSWDEITRRQPADAINSVTVKYHDREKSKDASVAVHNIAQIQQTGEMVSTTRNYVGIMKSNLATRVGTRDVRSLGAGMADGRVTAKRSVEGLNPGDPFRLVSSRHGFAGEVMRAIGLRFGDGRKNAIGLKFAQDVFHLGQDVLVDSSEGDWENPLEPPGPVNLRLVQEMPWRDLVQTIGATDAAALLSNDPDAGLLQVACGQPSEDTIDAIVAIDEGAGYQDAADDLQFAPAAVLDEALGASPSSIEVTIRDGVDLELLEVGMIAVIIGSSPATSEIVRVDAIAGNALTLGRGCLDTTPQYHEEGASIVFFEDFTFSDMEARAAATAIEVKIKAITGKGELDIDDAPADNVTFASRAIRPYRPADVKVNGGSAGPVDVVGVNPIPVTWARRNRLTESGVAIWTDADATSEAAQTTTITLTDLAGVTVHSYTGLAGTSHYVDSADFGGRLSGYIVASSMRDGYTSWQSYRVEVILSNLSISGAPVLTAVEGVPYDGFTVTASDGVPPYVYSLVGTWPTGIAVDVDTGDVAGAPSEGGTFAGLSVRVTDANGYSTDLRSFTLTVTSGEIVDPNALAYFDFVAGVYEFNHAPSSLTQMLDGTDLGGFSASGMKVAWDNSNRPVATELLRSLIADGLADGVTLLFEMESTSAGGTLFGVNDAAFNEVIWLNSQPGAMDFGSMNFGTTSLPMNLPGVNRVAFTLSRDLGGGTWRNALSVNGSAITTFGAHFQNLTYDLASRFTSGIAAVKLGDVADWSGYTNNSEFFRKFAVYPPMEDAALVALSSGAGVAFASASGSASATAVGEYAVTAVATGTASAAAAGEGVHDAVGVAAGNAQGVAPGLPAVYDMDATASGAGAAAAQGSRLLAPITGDSTTVTADATLTVDRAAQDGRAQAAGTSAASGAGASTHNFLLSVDDTTVKADDTTIKADRN
ncbi:VWA domain-containing protein [Sinorhizobium fredii]